MVFALSRISCFILFWFPIAKIRTFSEYAGDLMIFNKKNNYTE